MLSFASFPHEGHGVASYSPAAPVTCQQDPRGHDRHTWLRWALGSPGLGGGAHRVKRHKVAPIPPKVRVTPHSRGSLQPTEGHLVNTCELFLPGRQRLQPRASRTHSPHGLGQAAGEGSDTSARVLIRPPSGNSSKLLSTSCPGTMPVTRPLGPTPL